MEPAHQIERNHLLTVDIGNERPISAIEVNDIKFLPGEKGGLHIHPCPVTGYIVYGAAVIQVEGQMPVIVRAGEAFYEPPGKRIIQFRNYSKKKPLKFIAFYLLNGEQKLIEML